MGDYGVFVLLAFAVVMIILFRKKKIQPVMDKVFEQVDKVMDPVHDAIDEAAEKAGDALEEARERVVERMKK